MVFQLENLTSCRSKKKKTQTSHQFIHMFPQSLVSFSWHLMASTKTVCPSGHLGGLLPWKPTQCPQPPSKQLQDHLFQKLCDCSKLKTNLCLNFTSPISSYMIYYKSYTCITCKLVNSLTEWVSSSPSHWWRNRPDTQVQSLVKSNHT